MIHTRVIIAGSREFNDYCLLQEECLEIFRQLKSEGYNTHRDVLEIISGTAYGADQKGEQFANRYNLKLKKFPADWSIGKQAGYIRNKTMADYAKQDEELGVLIAFHNGVSKGTGHMIDLANKYGLRVFVIKF